MAKEKRRFRHPTAEEQVVLREMEVRLLTQPRDYARFDQLLVEHWSLDLFPEHRRSIVDNARGCRLGGGGLGHGLKARRAGGGRKWGSALGELLA